MQEELLREISRQLATMTRLIALSLGEGKTQRDQIDLLYRAGLEPKQIAEIVDSTSNAVSVAIYKLKAASRKQRKGRA